MTSSRNSRPPPSISELWVYPIKACRGISLQRAWLEREGLRHDRRMMIVDDEGKFVTQRQLPGLARIVTSLLDGQLCIDVGDERIRMPLDAVPRDTLRVRVWRDEVEANLVDERADAALSQFLGRPVRLVRVAPHARRACDPAYAPKGSYHAFADGFPLLVTNEASLDEVNDAIQERGGEVVPMRRFRPNIVLKGLARGAEDAARALVLEGTRILLVKRCDRCAVTTVDQDSGAREGPEPIRTLKAIRRNDRTGGFWFGQNGVPSLLDGDPAELAVGMPCSLR